MTRSNGIAALALILLMAAPLTTATAQEVPTLGPNLMITLHVGGTDPGVGPVDRTYKMAAISGRPADILMGWRTPIPAETQVDPDGEPVTTYVYQNVGMSATINAVALDGGRVHLKGQIEISGKEAKDENTASDGRPPVIGTFQQAVQVILQDGQPMRVAEVPDPDGGTHFLEITVEVLK